ncbi:TonB-dependent receptor [Steroidobacter sp. S1-65]|uniref:TonB-dependent receptor n=1 Tax=Steroidobacter gossypii TaxID=2805490 RepID=A0ABS1WV58_9GAMM|nr:TonB-dependent receptor [Steroidobacter gossypii]MBM0104857.1 TonB-dependent receptor [Steroidobacter gossypii]
MTRTRSLKAAILLCLMIRAEAYAQAQAVDIPPGDLAATLESFAKQTGMELIFSADQLEGLRTQGAKGALTPEQAISKLIEGTSLTMRIDPSGAILIAKPQSPAAVAPAADPRQTASDAHPGSSLEEIIVTAQKRAENIQDVPLAVTAVTGEQLEIANVREFGELMKVSPSLSIRPADSAQNASINIRGIGTFAFSIGVESAVAIQIDDVPLAFQARAFSDLTDIERIDVLRGPQSTLYGKNASAGLINIVTKAPGDSFAGRASISATSDDEYAGNISLSGPVTEELSIGFGAAYREFDGNVSNLTTGETVNGSENSSARLRAVWEPSAGMSFDLNLNYAEVDSDPVYTYRVLSPDVRLRGNATQTRDIIMPGITPGSDNLQVTLDDQPLFRSEAFGQSLRASFDLPQGFTLLSITAYDEYESFDRIDSDRTQTTVLRNFADGRFDADSLTQEIRLLSPSSGAVRTTAGLFYANSEQRREYKRGPAFSLAEWNATAGSEQIALFGQADWEFVPRTTLTLGLRGQREKVDYTFNDLRTTPVAHFAGDSTDEVTTYRVGVKHDLSDDLMMFVSYARGHKGEAYDLTTGFNQTRANLGPILAEKSDAYEAGFRAQMFDRRFTLNGTIFHTDYRNLQIQSIEDIQGVPTFRLTNAGESRTRGVEVDFMARLFNRFNLFGGLAYLDAEFIDHPTATCYPGQTAAQGCTGTPPRQDLSGTRLGVPQWRANTGFDVTVPIAGDLEGLLSGALSWQSRTPSVDPSTPIDAYTIVNLSAGVRMVDRGWTLRLFVNNVFDEGYVVAIGNQSGTFGGQPAVDFLPPRDFERHAGVRLTKEF